MPTDRNLTGPPPVDTVIFDYGEVISLPQEPDVRTELERLSDVDPAVFWDAYWAQRRSYDLGCSSSEFWDRVAKHAGADWNATRRQQLWAVDVAGWLRVRPASVDIVTRIIEKGVRVALLSNAPADIAGALRASPLLQPFHALFFSCDLGMCKPDPAIYTRVLRELGTTPERTVFVDDRADNVHAAREVGIDAHHYAETGGLRSFLTDRGVL